MPSQSAVPALGIDGVQREEMRAERDPGLSIVTGASNTGLKSCAPDDAVRRLALACRGIDCPQESIGDQALVAVEKRRPQRLEGLDRLDGRRAEQAVGMCRRKSPAG